MRRVFSVCLCLSTFAGSTTTVWATDLALPPPLPPPTTSVVDYRWSGCHAGANAGYAWSRQQEAWSGNAAPAPAQQAAASTSAAAPPSSPPPANNQNGNGGWQPHKPPVYGHGDKDWWHHHDDNYKDHHWSYDDKHMSGHHDGKTYEGKTWPESGSKGGYDKYADHDWQWHSQQYAHDKDKYDKDKYADAGWKPQHAETYDRDSWLRHDRDDAYDKHAGYGWAEKQPHDDHDKPGSSGWSKQPSNGEHESYAWMRPDHDKDGHDKDGWEKHDKNYDHGGHAWQPTPPNKPGWPPNNPPANNGGGQPPQQNPPPAQGNNGAAANTAVLLQTPVAASSNAGDVIGGIQLGCDYQMDRFVLGIQAMADLGIINASTSIAPQLTANTRTSNLYTATARAGYLVTPAVMAYVRGGAAWTRTSVAVVNNATGQSASVAFNRTGWTVGAGVEWMFARNWSAFAEYDYADFGSVTGSLPNAAAVTGGPNVVSLKSEIHTAVVGINYRFVALAGR
jgi:opacity protein-like surface antigen